MSYSGYMTPNQQLMSNPAYTGLTQTTMLTRQKATADLAALDQKYGDLFQMGYQMSPMASALNQAATRGIMTEQQSGQMVSMGGGGMSALFASIGYMSGDSSQLGNILNTQWNPSGGMGVGAMQGGAMGGYAPQMGGYAPQMGGYAPQMGGYAPQMGGYAPQAGGGMDMMQILQLLMALVQQLSAKKS